MAPSENDSFDESAGGVFFESPGGARGLNTGFFIGGTFTAIGATPCARLAQYNPLTGAVTEVGGGIASGTVRALCRWKNKLVIGGSFTLGGGKDLLMTWDGASYAALGAGVTGGVGAVVSTIITDGNDLLIGGYFDTVDGVTCYSTARYSDASSTWGPLYDLDTPGNCYQLLKDSGNIYCVGDFDNVNGVAINSKSKNGGVLNLAAGPAGRGYVQAVGVFGSYVYLGASSPMDGDTFNAITYLGGGNYGNSAWNKLGDPIHSTDGINGTVSQTGVGLSVFSGKLYVTGSFSDADGLSSVGNIAAWDGANWSRLLAGLNGIGNGMYVWGGKLWVGGAFTTPASYCATWNGTAFSSVAGFNDAVYCFGEMVI